MQLSTRRSVYAVMMLFGLNGLTVGGWGGAIASVVAKHALSLRQLSTLLVVMGAFACVAMLTGGRLTDRYGARRGSLTGVAGLAAAIVAVGVAPNFAGLVGAAALPGSANGLLDVAMNAMGVAVEKARTKPIMSFFHGFWSVGQLAGTSITILLGRVCGVRGAPAVLPVAVVVAVVTLLGLIVLFRITPETPVIEHVTDSGKKAKIPKAAWSLGLAAIAFGLGEGTAMDWSGVHLTRVCLASPDVAATGLAAVSGLMMVVRLTGDLVVQRLGRRTTVRLGSVVAAGGYVLTATMTSLPVVLVGWALVGMGVGLIAPQVYAVAGHMSGGRGLATVVTFGYVAFLAGPMIIGFVAARVGIAHTMFLPAALMLATLGIAAVIPATSGTRHICK